MKLKNILLVIKDQLPLKRAFRNFFITRNALGLFSKNSHIIAKTGLPKIGYNTKASSLRAAENMMKKYPDAYFSSYKCLHCDKYHIGKSRK